MKLTNLKIANILIESFDDKHKLLQYFYIIENLLKNYWKKIFLIETIKNLDSDIDVNEILKLIKIFKKLKLFEKSRFKIVEKIIVNTTNLPKKIELNCPTNLKQTQIDDFENNLKLKYDNIEFEKLNYDQLWVYVSWDWMIYKKNLKKDIEKLLS